MLSPAVWSPDGRALAYSADHRLWVYMLDQGEQDVAPVDSATALSWSSRLNLIALIDRGVVWTLRPDGTNRHAIPLPGVAGAVAWSPGSDRLAVVLRREVDGQTRAELWLVNADGEFRRTVIRAPVDRAIHDLQWFSDSLYLLYGLSPATEPVMSEAWRTRISYPDHRRIPLPTPATAVRLAPSGRLLAVVGENQVTDGMGRILVTHLDGSGRLAITPQAGRYTGLAWSPQGDKVAFAEMVDSFRAEVWIADADGSGQIHVSSYGLEYRDRGTGVASAWSPDGRHVVFGTDTGRSVGPIWLVTLQRR